MAFVSGSARGIGKAIAIRLAGDGFDLALNDVVQALLGLKEVAEEVKALGECCAEDCNFLFSMML